MRIRAAVLVSVGLELLTELGEFAVCLLLWLLASTALQKPVSRCAWGAEVCSAWSLEHCASCDLSFLVGTYPGCESFGVLLGGSVLEQVRTVLLSMGDLSGASTMRKESRCSF